MDLNLNNTLTRQTEKFEPANSKSDVNLYVCGPTVYERAHLGNLRVYVFADFLRRTLKFAGYRVKTVMNITDVDDKTISATIKKFGQTATPKDLRKYTTIYYQNFLTDLTRLNIDRSRIKFIRVSDVIPAIQKSINELINKGYAYLADDKSTYFNLEHYQQNFGHYGQLVGEKFLAGKKIGASLDNSLKKRITTDDYDKKDLSDFVLWKAPAPDEGKISWADSTLGSGRPGWHIECSTINALAFSKQIVDIHLGGVDLIFPHHSNEIAQSEVLTGHKFVNYWLHSGHLTVDGQKMSKSLGNFLTLNDLIDKGSDPLAYRYLLLQSNYKQTINFTWDSFTGAVTGYKNLKIKITKLKKLTNCLTRFLKPSQFELDQTYLKNFTEKISQLNSAAGLAILQEVLGDKNLSPTRKLKLIRTFDQVLGLKL